MVHLSSFPFVLIKYPKSIDLWKYCSNALSQICNSRHNSCRVNECRCKHISWSNRGDNKLNISLVTHPLNYSL